MATVREGNKGVLLVVDVQVGVMRESWEVAHVIHELNIAMSWLRYPGRTKGASPESPVTAKQQTMFPELVGHSLEDGTR